MDKQTSEKLNDTLEKMGAIGEGHSSAADSAQSSDMSFYVIMLALIVAMGFYISYDSSQRYGTGTSSSADSSLTGSAQELAIEPVIISIEKVKTVEIIPVAVIEATESTPEAVIVEKVEQKTVVTTAVIPVEDIVKTEAAPVVENVESVPVIVAEPKAPAVTAPAATQSMIPAMDIMMQAAKDAATPVIEAVEKVAEKTEAAVTETVAEPVMPVMPTPVVQVPAPQPEQAYNPYGYQYGQPQNNYYQQQPQYGNPYGNPYGNQYGNPYGYGNNPYQQRAAQPGQ